MDSLKPCPFCGGEAETWSHYFEEEDITLWQVRCKERPYDVEHPCYTADSFISFTTEAEAIEAWNTRAERTTQNVTDAWNEWGVNVFNDESLDDFDRFEKVYQICQEIVEPIELTCHVRELGGIQGSIPILLCRACGEPNYARADGSAWNYCPNCGSKVIANEMRKNG